ncbi:hypothetical protein RRG08_026643 [Elysia crispata]|uniref:Uncharacterized protein n=1 Tax=Elysia crispata TaxID=231223 RepID=A0AAE1AYW1_9GAST|nr:hypothetical protein RRG08_026643 [Elysia crispata]
MQELWHRLFRKNDSADACDYTDFHSFLQYVDGEKREKALKVTALSVVSTESIVGRLSSPEIPVAIGCFYQLTSLQIKGCHLTTLPWSLVYLKQLQKFDLSNNRLQCLPSTIGSLSSLHSLNVENNQLLVLPSALLRLAKLKELLLSGNETLQSPDYNVCQQGLKVVLETISQRACHVNIWAGCKLAGTPHHQDRTEVPSLFSLASNTITSSKLDFLSVPFVPPRLKTFLVEANKFEIKVAKCSSCHGFFSNNPQFPHPWECGQIDNDDYMTNGKDAEPHITSIEEAESETTLLRRYTMDLQVSRLKQHLYTWIL